MPTASDELRAKMLEYFGPDGIDCVHAINWLKAKSLADVKGHYLIPEDFSMTSKDINCLNFLVEEWDFDWKWEGIV